MKLPKTQLFFLVMPALVACGGEDMSSTFNNSGSGCSEFSDACGGEQICISGTCEAAFNRIYRIAVADGQIAGSKPDSTPWDDSTGELGRPDPYVVFYVDGVEIGRTTVAQDTNTPVWNEYIDAELVPGSSITLEMKDSDLVFDDDIFTCTADPISADLLRARSIACEDSGMTGTSFRGLIQPKT